MNKQDLSEMITDACNESNPILANLLITLAHSSLSKRLHILTGESAGANFHSWAVWGSKKAGVTIRQEDLDQALRNAKMVSGVCGLLVGLCLASVVVNYFPPSLSSDIIVFCLLGLGAMLGAVFGASVGLAIARSSREKAADLVLAGNRLVLDDIGRRTADFVLKFEDKNSESPIEENELRDFIDSSIYKSGEREEGAYLLEQAFSYYARAVNEVDEKKKQQNCYFANCLAILHEHQKLQPYIQKSLPFIVSRCVTRRMLSFDIGSKQLAVSENIPTLEGLDLPENLESLEDPRLLAFLDKWSCRAGSRESSAARNWTRIEDRMSYIVDLFRYCHLEPSVFDSPYTDQQCRSIYERRIPDGAL
jgi:hypothetical protein